MPATEADLIAAIVADPDDRDARQIYADWLARAGDPRGELIHLELARETMREGDDEYDAIVARIDQIVAEHHAALLAPLWSLQIPDVRYKLHLGLPAWVAGTTEAIAAASVRLSAKAPLVTRLEVDMQFSLKPLVATTVLGRATAMSIRARTFEDKSLAVLGDELAELRELTLRGALRPSVLDWLVDAELPRLRRLVLTGSTFGPVRQRLEPVASRGWTALEPLARLRSPLRHFELVGVGASLGPQLAEIVGALPCSLSVIVLAGNALGAAGLHALLPALGPTEYVDLGDNELTYDTLGPLLGALSSVRVLRLRDNALGDHGAELIAGWAGANQLHTLDLSRNGITDRGALALATSAELANLRVLRIDGPLKSATCRALARSKHLPQARIYSNNIRLDRSPSKSKRHRGA
ncbi:MAG TPA: TIGR02996 domain-containing protein [Kofleriaceae bacterium]